MKAGWWFEKHLGAWVEVYTVTEGSYTGGNVYELRKEGDRYLEGEEEIDAEIVDADAEPIVGGDGITVRVGGAAIQYRVVVKPDLGDENGARGGQIPVVQAIVVNLWGVGYKLING